METSSEAYVLVLQLDVPIILCTGFSELISKGEAQQLGVRKYLMKPLVKRKLAVAVREVLDGG